MKKILYVGNFKFPNLDAASHRVLGNSKILKELGYEISFLGNNEVCREDDLSENGEYKYQDFKYQARKFSKNKFKKINDNYSDIKYIVEEIKKQNIEIIICYHLPFLTLFFLNRYCRENGIMLIGDITEWYSIKHILNWRNPFSILGIINSEARMRLTHKVLKNLIVISSFLEEYYKKFNLNLIKIPPLIDKNDKKWCRTEKKNIKESEDIKYCYFGNPGKKDLLKKIVKAFELENNINIKLIIIGINKEEYEKIYKTKIKKSLNIKFCGRVSQDEAFKIIKNCNYSLIIRKTEKFAMAGFPTKFVESMMLGVPVIANKTSDLSNYLENKKNGFLIENYKIKNIRRIIITTSKIEYKEWEKMSELSKKIAIKYFDFRDYEEKMKNFLKGC